LFDSITVFLSPSRSAFIAVKSVVSVLVASCGLRFEVRGEDKVVELMDAHYRTVLVCTESLAIVL
jgi:hypothetical protein